MKKERAKDVEKHWKTETPTQTDLEELEESESPGLHNYMCIGTKQLTIRKAYKTWYIASRGWKPKEYRIKIRAGYYTLNKTDEWEKAKEKFTEYAEMIIQEEKHTRETRAKRKTKYLSEEAIKDELSISN